MPHPAIFTNYLYQRKISSQKQEIWNRKRKEKEWSGSFTMKYENETLINFRTTKWMGRHPCDPNGET